MVKSLLVNEIYRESKSLKEGDVNFVSSMYEAQIYDMKIIIALGQSQHEFSEKGVVYYPIYLVSKNRVDIDARIGVYEQLSSNASANIDENGEPDISSFGEPRLYSFVTEDFIKKSELAPELDEETVLHETDELFNELFNELGDEINKITMKEFLVRLYDKTGRKDEFKLWKKRIKEHIKAKFSVLSNKKADDGTEREQQDDTLSKLPLLPEQTAEMSKNEKSNYVFNDNDPWLQKYFNNSNYEIINNEGGGDCFFISLRDGLKEIGRNISVMELRELVARNVTPNVFNNYKENYDNVVSAMRSLREEHSNLKAQRKELIKKIEETKDSPTSNALIEQNDEMKQRIAMIKSEFEGSKQLANDFKIMKGVNSIDDFKSIILTSKYWADTWTITTLEKELNVKHIIFSKEAFNQEDYKNIIQCGQLNDETREEFNPSHYIMVNYLGNHYELVKYKGRGALTFREIPYDVKEMIINRCLKGESGTFNIIPDFNNIKLEKVANNETENENETDN
tara:strand:- start:962 stop:2491 length:1530 start_codon:yes stop_codon:yes gene_type:complete